MQMQGESKELARKEQGGMFFIYTDNEHIVINSVAKYNNLQRKTKL